MIHTANPPKPNRPHADGPPTETYRKLLAIMNMINPPPLDKLFIIIIADHSFPRSANIWTNRMGITGKCSRLTSSSRAAAASSTARAALSRSIASRLFCFFSICTNRHFPRKTFLMVSYAFRPFNSLVMSLQGTCSDGQCLL